MTDERLARLRAACCDDSAIDPSVQAAYVAFTLRRLQLSRNFSDTARELRQVKDKLAELFEADAG